MHRPRKKLLFRFLCSILISIFLEVFIFNWSSLKNSIQGATAVAFSRDLLHYQNWADEDGGIKRSLSDPMVYIDGLSISAESLTIQADIEPMPDTYTIFYTTSPLEVFSSEKMISVKAEPGTIEVPLGKRIYALRVDPGESAGQVLHDITLSFHGLGWNFSISRIIAMLSIYWGAVGLTLLQKAPDYGIGSEKEGDMDGPSFL